jgi:hypothetical protein
MKNPEVKNLVSSPFYSEFQLQFALLSHVDQASHFPFTVQETNIPPVTSLHAIENIRIQYVEGRQAQSLTQEGVSGRICFIILPKDCWIPPPPPQQPRRQAIISVCKYSNRSPPPSAESNSYSQTKAQILLVTTFCRSELSL